MKPHEVLSQEQVLQLLVMTTEQAATFLGMSRQTLESLRVKGDGPRYAKLGRLVRYRREALLGWVSANERAHTSEEAQ